MNKPTVIGMSHDELRQAYMNARKTGLGAGGHGKGHRNEEQAAEFALELKASGWAVPTDKEAIEHGVFNGPGSL